MRTTLVFVVLAAISAGLAWWSKPEAISKESDVTEDRVGQDVFPGFNDPELAASLEIIQYDETLAQLKPFVVAKDRQTGLWKLPSHDGYPADAAEQVRDATTPLIGLRILSIASTDRGDHELYGVVSPEDSSLAAGSSGIGMLVRLKDATGKVLAALIIGKEVEGTVGQRYVRIPTEDVVYTVEIDTRAFTTDFRDWIDDQLLDVRGFDIARVGVRDYELVQQANNTMGLTRNFDATVAYDAAQNRWSLVDYRVYRGGAALPAEPEPGQTLNTRFLNDLRIAVQDLQIINVKRKPAALAEALRAETIELKDQQSIASLQEQGYFPAQGPQGTEIYASGGETIIGTVDGVEYVLKFGKAAASLGALGGDGQADSGGLSRFLIVQARLDPAQFPQPDLEVLPETVEELLARDKEQLGDDAPADETEEELRERLEVVREQIAKENQRKIDERNERMEAARQRVEALNARFSDWYYIVADNLYRRLRITRDTLFTSASNIPGGIAPAADGNPPPITSADGQPSAKKPPGDASGDTASPSDSTPPDSAPAGDASQTEPQSLIPDDLQSPKSNSPGDPEPPAADSPAGPGDGEGTGNGKDAGNGNGTGDGGTRPPAAVDA
ncbi:MAG: DUF4340 domain-containing protein [Planctomycetota bacterium]|nr:MAG: DUF4340 domain-containing protein [Planctomycetota bacterium]